MAARLSEEERRARAEDKAIRSLAWHARRLAAQERRDAQARHRAELTARALPSVTWVAAEPAPPPPPARRSRRRRSKGIEAAPTLVDLVEPAARAHGVYVVEALTVGPGELEPGAAGGTIRVLRNRGGTTVERWLSKGAMTTRQMEGIAMFARLHRLRYEGLSGSRVVANWSLVGSFRGGTVDFHDICARQADAKKLLDFLDEEVLFRFGLDEQEIFRNVVLHDEPAGVAGGRLGYRNDRAEAAAKVIVLMIADQVADALALGRKRRTEEWCRPARA